jgi:zinc protease
VRRAAAAYFREDTRTVGHFIPKAVESNGVHGGSNGSGASSLKRALTPHGYKFHHDPPGEDESGAETGSTKAGGVTPCASGQARSGGAGFASRVVREELETGTVLLVLENAATPTVAVCGSLRAGSHFEPKGKPGLARITAEMLKRGTQKRGKPELAGALERVGADVEFDADAFAVQISARSLSEDFPALASTLAEMLREPSFPADELEKLKQQTIAAVREQQSDTSWRAYERLTQTLFDEHNPFYTHAGERLVESVSSITVEDVRGFYERFYGGRTLILSVTGDVRASDAVRVLREALEGFGGPEGADVDVTDPEPPAAGRRELVLVRDKANVDVLLGTAAPLRRDAPDYYAAVLANRALGESTLSSRLGLQVRDAEGLTYGIASRFRAPSLAAGPWYIAVSVNPGNVERAIDSTLGVLREYVEHGIRPEELSDEKSSAVGAFKVSLSTNAGLARAVWNSEFYGLGLDYVEHYPELIGRVTVEEVNAAIRKYFRPERLTVVIAGDLDPARGESAPVA